MNKDFPSGFWVEPGDEVINCAVPETEPVIELKGESWVDQE